MRVRGSDRGAALVEFMFVFPAIMLLFVAAVNVGLAVISSSAGTNAAREAARVATVRYECVDNHVSLRCPLSTSTNYTAVKAAAIAKLGGMVPPSSITMTVQCRQSSGTGTVVLCEKSLVKPDNDVVVVTMGWNTLGGSKWVPGVARSTRVVMSIIGRPDLAPLAPEPDTYGPAVVSGTGCLAKDADANGVIDRVEITFDEDLLQSVSAGAFTLVNSVTGSSTIASATVSGRVVTLTLGGATVNTAIGSMNVTLSASATGVRDLSGNQGSFTNCGMTDSASPKLIAITDTPGLVNGKMEIGDTVVFSFSEPIGLGLGSTTVTETDPNGGGNDTIQIVGITSGPATTNSDTYISSNNSSATFAAVAVAVSNTVVVTLGAPTCGLCTNVGAGNDATAFSITVSTSLGDAAGNVSTGTGTISKIF